MSYKSHSTYTCDKCGKSITKDDNGGPAGWFYVGINGYLYGNLSAPGMSEAFHFCEMCNTETNKNKLIYDQLYHQ